ncbi:cytochrome c oxidase subunit 3 family protein [Roseiconus nitratireducens]|uniref:Cytochrome c oxidase subunit 3 family protein n=1 Tax=Roseiconus nitratireducens TaxID=2605748 RepID=A0A5M6D7I1_9BACT|nr:cytochrome c oxidase subunit 3 [Roseiconus nitratireducens]KAA5541809.1 cytochrome c oxidase subunit 3 family protein [Roseiconus nitratireducens]
MANEMSSEIAIPYDSADQQRSAATFGMWVFLATEVLFFGGLFVGYVVYRYEYPEAFRTGSAELNLWSGGAMTLLLLLGSMLVAVVDHLIAPSADNRSSLRGPVVRRLVATTVLGIAFLALEFHEYHQLIQDGRFPGHAFRLSDVSSDPLDGRSVEMFFTLFFCMTGLHAFHMCLGILLVGGMAVAIGRSEQPRSLANPMSVIGLYWHFVDIIWVFLYPLFYLVR